MHLSSRRLYQLQRTCNLYNLLTAYCDDSDSDNNEAIIKKYEKQNIDQPVSSNTDDDDDDDATKQVSLASSSSSSSQPAESYPTLYL